MKCPACSRELVPVKLPSMTVDVCKGGCAGMWFNHFELLKVEYSSAQEGETLLKVEKDPHVQVDLTKKRTCPACQIPMMQHFFSVKRKVTIDECPKCAGYWLDSGELATIRAEFANEQERVAATEKYINDSFGGQMKSALAEDKAAIDRALKFRNVFGIISPGNYSRK